MNILTDTWRGLVRRRLWPVALLLIAALAAVPHFLAKQPEPAPAPALPAAVTGAAAATPAPTLVSVSDDPQGGRRRYVLGARKDPFEPAPLPKVKKAKKKKAATATKKPTTGAEAGTGTGTGSGSGGGTPPPSTPPVATPTPAPSKPTYPANSLQVNFGAISGTLTKRTLEKGKALPSEGNPVLVYMGLADHGKVAEFMVGSDVASLEGDGSCDTGCTTLRLKAGDTEFVTMQQGVQYELDLLKIHASAKAKATASAARAHAARRAPRPRTHF
jgi:hypothetical protein